MIPDSPFSTLDGNVASAVERIDLLFGLLSGCVVVVWQYMVDGGFRQWWFLCEAFSLVYFVLVAFVLSAHTHLHIVITLCFALWPFVGHRSSAAPFSCCWPSYLLAIA